MPAGGRDDHGPRRAVVGGHDVQLAAAADPVCRVRAAFPPPHGALSRPPSVTTSARSSRKAARRRVTSFAAIVAQSPWWVHSLSRRRTVRLLAPSSIGRSRQPIPVFGKNTIDVNTVRLSIGLRPPLREC